MALFGPRVFQSIAAQTTPRDERVSTILQCQTPFVISTVVTRSELVKKPAGNHGRLLPAANMLASSEKSKIVQMIHEVMFCSALLLYKTIANTVMTSAERT